MTDTSIDEMGPTADRLMHDLLDAAEGRSVLLLTHRPEGLERADDVVEVSRCCN